MAGQGLLLAFALALSLSLSGCGAAGKQEAGLASGSTSSGKNYEFTLWNEGAPALKALKEYVQDVTDEKSKNFIPKEDRIAAFDMDGTLYGELAPRASGACYRVRQKLSSSYLRTAIPVSDGLWDRGRRL